MHMTGYERIEKSERYIIYPATLSRPFCNFRPTARHHVHLVYCVTTGPQIPPIPNSYHGTLQAPHLLLPVTSTHTSPEDLLIAWVDEKNNLVYGFARELGRHELKHQAVRARQTFEESELLTTYLVQRKDEIGVSGLGRAGIQTDNKYDTSKSHHVPTIDEPGDTVRVNTISIRQAWDISQARHFSYVRLKQSLRLLGVVDSWEQHQLLNWLREQGRLEWSQMLYQPWELWHLKLVMDRWKRCAWQARLVVGETDAELRT